MGGRSSKNDLGVYDADDEEIPGRGCCGCFAKGVSISRISCWIILPGWFLQALTLVKNSAAMYKQ